MPEINIKIKIKGGIKTTIEVQVESLAVKPRVFRFANGNEISDRDIADWLTECLDRKLISLQNPLYQYGTVIPWNVPD